MYILGHKGALVDWNINIFRTPILNQGVGDSHFEKVEFMPTTVYKKLLFMNFTPN